jgi:hypothetical protein
MKRRWFFSVAIVIFSISGCTLTPEQGSYSHVSSGSLPSGVSLSGADYFDLQVLDRRVDEISELPIADPHILFRKRNGYNQPMDGAYLTDKPLADYVQQAFSSTLEQSSAKKNSSSPISIVIAINHLGGHTLSRGLFSTKQQVVMAVDFYLIDRTKQVGIFRYRVVGKSDLLTKSVFLSVEDVLRSLPGAIDDVVSQSLSLKEVREILLKNSSATRPNQTT